MTTPGIDGKQRGYKGSYNGVSCRSLGEFHVALWLSHGYFGEQKGTFKTEPCRLAMLNGRHKIPDFASHVNGEFVIWEIKCSEEECIEVEALYREQLPYLFSIPGLTVKFINSKTFTPKVKQIICIAKGEEYYKAELEKYKAQAPYIKQMGFPGELTPMYGKRQTRDTIEKIKASLVGKMTGDQNPNYGNTHSDAAKVEIGKKWYDSATKATILRNSFMNRINILTEAEYMEYCSFCYKVFTGTVAPSENPKFMNGVTKMTPKRIAELFGTYENFWNFIRIAE